MSVQTILSRICVAAHRWRIPCTSYWFRPSNLALFLACGEHENTAVGPYIGNFIPEALRYSYLLSHTCRKGV